MESIFYGQWQIDHNINVELAERNLLRYLSRAGEGSKTKKMAGLQLKTKWLASEVVDYGKNNKRVKLGTVYSHLKNTEDNQFSNATPSGSCEQMISNPDETVQAFFKPGVKYYATWEECEDQS